MTESPKRPPISGGVLEKLDRTRREKFCTATEWRKAGFVTEADEWLEVVRILESIK